VVAWAPVAEDVEAGQVAECLLVTTLATLPEDVVGSCPIFCGLAVGHCGVVRWEDADVMKSRFGKVLGRCGLRRGGVPQRRPRRI
jgi:hypothetical protein